MTPTRTLLLSLGLGASSVCANTIQDFEATFSPLPPSVNTRFDQSGSNPPAAWFDGTVDGWDGGYVQLTDAVNSQNNAISINDSTGAGWNTLTLDFDFRGSIGAAGGADGFGILLFPTSLGADTTTAPPNWQPEEPNVAGSFGLGLDTWANGDETGLGDEPASAGGNHTSLHWNGATISSNTTLGSVVPEFLLGNGTSDYIRGQLVLDVTAGTVSLTLDSAQDGIGTNVLTQYNNVPIAGLAADDFRVALRGRTGGANELIQFDNIRATTDTGGVVIDEDFSSAPSTPMQVPAVATGGTAYTVETIAGTPATLVTEGANTEHGAGVEPGALRLTTEAGDQRNIVSFDQTSIESGIITGSFELRGISNEASRADGLGFLLVDAATYGTTGSVGDNSIEEGGLADAFGIGFDTYKSGGDDVLDDDAGNYGNHISIRYDGNLLGVVNIDETDPAAFDIVNGEFNTVDFTLTEVAGGYELDLTVTDGTDGSVSTIYDDFFIPGMDFDGGARAVFSARTGGAFDEYSLDNVNILFAVPEPGSASLLGLTVGALLLRRRRK